MDLAKPSDRRMADRSPCLVLGKSCRGGCGNNGDDDGDEMERALTRTKHVAPRRMAAVVAMVSSGARRSDGGGGERMLGPFLVAWCVWRAMLLVCFARVVLGAAICR